MRRRTKHHFIANNNTLYYYSLISMHLNWKRLLILSTIVLIAIGSPTFCWAREKPKFGGRQQPYILQASGEVVMRNSKQKSGTVTTNTAGNQYFAKLRNQQQQQQKLAQQNKEGNTLMSPSERYWANLAAWDQQQQQLKQQNNGKKKKTFLFPIDENTVKTAVKKENKPLESPRKVPSVSPRKEPSVSPRKEPSESPRKEPSESPRKEPSESPRKEPLENVSNRPLESPRKESPSKTAEFSFPEENKKGGLPDIEFLDGKFVVPEGEKHKIVNLMTKTTPNLTKNDSQRQRENADEKKALLEGQNAMTANNKSLLKGDERPLPFKDGDKLVDFYLGKSEQSDDFEKQFDPLPSPKALEKTNSSRQAAVEFISTNQNTLDSVWATIGEHKRKIEERKKLSKLKQTTATTIEEEAKENLKKMKKKKANEDEEMGGDDEEDEGKVENSDKGREAKGLKEKETKHLQKKKIVHLKKHLKLVETGQDETEEELEMREEKSNISIVSIGEDQMDSEQMEEDDKLKKKQVRKLKLEEEIFYDAEDEEEGNDKGKGTLKTRTMKKWKKTKKKILEKEREVKKAKSLTEVKMEIEMEEGKMKKKKKDDKDEASEEEKHKEELKKKDEMKKKEEEGDIKETMKNKGMKKKEEIVKQEEEGTEKLKEVLSSNEEKLEDGEGHNEETHQQREVVIVKEEKARPYTPEEREVNKKIIAENNLLRTFLDTMKGRMALMNEFPKHIPDRFRALTFDGNKNPWRPLFCSDLFTKIGARRRHDGMNMVVEYLNRHLVWPEEMALIVAELNQNWTEILKYKDHDFANRGRRDFLMNQMRALRVLYNFRTVVNVHLLQMLELVRSYPSGFLAQDPEHKLSRDTGPWLTITRRSESSEQTAISKSSVWLLDQKMGEQRDVYKKLIRKECTRADELEKEFIKLKNKSLLTLGKKFPDLLHCQPLKRDWSRMKKKEQEKRKAEYDQCQKSVDEQPMPRDWQLPTQEDWREFFDVSKQRAPEVLEKLKEGKQWYLKMLKHFDQLQHVQFVKAAIEGQEIFKSIHFDVVLLKELAPVLEKFKAKWTLRWVGSLKFWDKKSRGMKAKINAHIQSLELLVGYGNALNETLEKLGQFLEGIKKEELPKLTATFMHMRLQYGLNNAVIELFAALRPLAMVSDRKLLEIAKINHGKSDEELKNEFFTTKSQGEKEVKQVQNEQKKQIDPKLREKVLRKSLYLAEHLVATVVRPYLTRMKKMDDEKKPVNETAVGDITNVGRRKSTLRKRIGSILRRLTFSKLTDEQVKKEVERGIRHYTDMAIMVNDRIQQQVLSNDKYSDKHSLKTKKTLKTITSKKASAKDFCRVHGLACVQEQEIPTGQAELLEEILLHKIH